MAVTGSIRGGSGKGGLGPAHALAQAHEFGANLP
jgi:hypothetical protein